MNVETIELRQLKPNPANLRLHPEGQIDKLKASLIRWGQTLPLLIDANNIVRVGNARYTAMREMNWEKVAVVRLDLSPSEWTALSIADNKLHDDSSFDTSALAQVLASLRTEDEELAQASGYTFDELDEILAEQKAAQNPTPPDDFDTYDEDIETDHECPKCKFRWSGSSHPAEAA